MTITSNYKSNYKSDNYFDTSLTGSFRVKFDNKSLNLLDIIFKKSFNHLDNPDNLNYFTNAQKELNATINQTINNYTKKHKSKHASESTIINPWINCLKQCKITLSNYINTETQSTAYYIRLLIHSIIRINESYKSNNKSNNIDNSLILSIKLKSDLDNGHILSGKWQDDYDKLIITGLETPNNVKPRLIMGFGPSASGKTRLITEILKILSDIENNNFPECFISIDGGIMRECSVIYQIVIKSIMNVNKNNKSRKHINGFANLVARQANKSLFASSIIREIFIKSLIANFQNKISIYIPETLGGCILTCNKIVKKGIELTGDSKWIGLLIWQHKKTTQCNYKPEFKCKGTITSGKIREQIEGKKYYSTSWYNSMRNGMRLVKKAPGYRFIIHNSGGLKTSNQINKSILEDHTQYFKKSKKRTTKKSSRSSSRSSSRASKKQLHIESYFQNLDNNSNPNIFIYCRNKECKQYHK